MYSKLLALITDPPNLSPYTHLWAHISAYMFFSVFPTRLTLTELWTIAECFERTLWVNARYDIDGQCLFYNRKSS